MLTDRVFRISLTISLVVHAAIFVKSPRLNLLSLRRLPEQLEITYTREKIAIPSSEFYTPKQISKKLSYQASNIKITPPPSLKKEKIFNASKNIPIRKPSFLKPEIIAAKKVITLPSLSAEKITTPIYLNYYQIVRKKIRLAAYQNYTRLVNGEVYLSFVILRSGRLKTVRINEERSTARTYLKEVAKKSIQEAAPFPIFPKDLNYPELSFNVVISFEIG